MNRTRLCFYLLLLTPLMVYWQTIFTEYGFHDDYSNMREAREEPGKLVKFTSSHGRPLYGALLETSFSKLDEVGSLQWPRLTSVALLTLLGLALWRQLYQSGWTEIEAAVIGLGVTLLPAAQVEVSWAVGWPHVLALVLALAGFAATEAELERGGMKRVVALLGGGMIYALAALIYQSNALFAVVPIVAILLVRSGREPATDLRWTIIHLAILLAGLLAAFLLVKFLFNTGVFQPDARFRFETNPFTKLAWFFWQPLPNALGLYFLRDDHNTGVWLLLLAIPVVVAVIVYGYRNVVEVKKSMVKKKWYLCLLIAPFLAHAVSFAAGERSIGYRTLFALSSLVLMMLVFALRSLLAAKKIPQAGYYSGLVVLVLIAALSAHLNAYTLIAQPQNREWEMVRSAVMRADFKTAQRVYLIRPAPTDRTTARTFVDEFGAVSGDSDWVPQEMFKAALHERFPVRLPAGGSYTVASGAQPPDEKAYDLIIDLRKLKEQREP